MNIEESNDELNNKQHNNIDHLKMERSSINFRERIKNLPIDHLEKERPKINLPAFEREDKYWNGEKRVLE